MPLREELERRRPDLLTAAWWKEERGERVFLDFNQNAPHKTVFGAWCVRARPGAQVSTPVSWDEIVAKSGVQGRPSRTPVSPQTKPRSRPSGAKAPAAIPHIVFANGVMGHLWTSSEFPKPGLPSSEVRFQVVGRDGILDLDEDRLTRSQHRFDAWDLLTFVTGDTDLTRIQHAVPRLAEIDERRLHPRQNVLDLAQVDVADQGVLLRLGHEVLGQHAILQDTDLDSVVALANDHLAVD